MKDGDEVCLSLFECIKLYVGLFYDIFVVILNFKNFLVIVFVLRLRCLMMYLVWQWVGLIYLVDDMMVYIDCWENGGVNIGLDSSMFDGFV